MLNRTYKFSVKVVNLTIHYLKHDFTNNNKNPTVLGKHKSRKWSQVLGQTLVLAAVSRQEAKADYYLSRLVNPSVTACYA